HARTGRRADGDHRGAAGFGLFERAGEALTGDDADGATEKREIEDRDDHFAAEERASPGERGFGESGAALCLDDPGAIGLLPRERNRVDGGHATVGLAK